MLPSLRPLIADSMRALATSGAVSPAGGYRMTQRSATLRWCDEHERKDLPSHEDALYFLDEAEQTIADMCELADAAEAMTKKELVEALHELRDHAPSAVVA